jgi:hypothetical protein
MFPPATWEFQAKQMPSGIGFWLQLVRIIFEQGLSDIVWPESMAIEGELAVRKNEEQKCSPCFFRELV